ncbi:MAG: hypothetical protein KDA98_01460, partial [Acidimicrobiales bacterium]|nr:hypothetical protein [Acidimicrobiales bacterium]
LLVAVAIAVFAISRSRKAATARTERERRALDEADGLAGHLASLVPERTQAVAAQDAPRLAALAAELGDLAGHGTPDRQVALGRVRGQVAALHGVVDSLAMAVEQPSEAAITHLREQATALHTTVAEVRAELFPSPGA